MATKIRLDSQVQGKLPANSLNNGNETIDGEKTFSSSPIVPTPTNDMEVANKKYVDDNANLFKYQIVTSVSSGNLTVALKNYLGQDPSVAVPVKVQIGNTIRTITDTFDGISRTLNAGTNWFNAGSSELATKEIDYFVYGIWNTANTGQEFSIRFARIPYATTRADFSTSSTNEKYGTTAAPASTECVLLGRFSAILSDGPSYTWSLGTGPIINYPIFETRELSFNEIIYGVSGSAGTFSSSLYNASYQIIGRKLYLNFASRILNIGSWDGRARVRLPFTKTDTTTTNGHDEPLFGYVASQGSNPATTNKGVPSVAALDNNIRFTNGVNTSSLNWGGTDIIANDMLVAKGFYNIG